MSNEDEPFILFLPEPIIERNVTPGKECATIRFDNSEEIAKLEYGTNNFISRRMLTKHRSK